MTVVASRFSRAGVHNPDVVSVGEPSGCGHSTGRSGGGDRGADGRDGVADRAAGRRQPVVGRGAGAGLRRPGGVRLVDDVTGSGISAPPVSATDVAVQGTRWQGSHR